MTQEEIKKVVGDMEFNLSTAKEDLIKVIDQFNLDENTHPYFTQKIDVMEQLIAEMEECTHIYEWNEEQFNNDSVMLLNLKKHSDTLRENFSKEVVSIYNDQQQ